MEQMISAEEAQQEWRKSDCFVWFIFTKLLIGCWIGAMLLTKSGELGGWPLLVAFLFTVFFFVTLGINSFRFQRYWDAVMKTGGTSSPFYMNPRTYFATNKKPIGWEVPTAWFTEEMAQ